jgi:anti-anti-sigma factor
LLVTLRPGTNLNNFGIKQRRVGTVTILDADRVLRISLKFGISGVSLERAVDSLLTAGQRQILLNLDGITAISAKGLGELVSIFARVARSGGEFKLFNVTPPVRQLMTAVKLAGVFGCYDSERDAIASFARAAAAQEPGWDFLPPL